MRSNAHSEHLRRRQKWSQQEACSEHLQVIARCLTMWLYNPRAVAASYMIAGYNHNATANLTTSTRA